jgi:hypothetical protein
VLVRLFEGENFRMKTGEEEGALVVVEGVVAAEVVVGLSVVVLSNVSCVIPRIPSGLRLLLNPPVSRLVESSDWTRSSLSMMLSVEDEGTEDEEVEVDSDGGRGVVVGLDGSVWSAKVECGSLAPETLLLVCTEATITHPSVVGTSGGGAGVAATTLLVVTTEMTGCGGGVACEGAEDAVAREIPRFTETETVPVSSVMAASSICGALVVSVTSISALSTKPLKFSWDTNWPLGFIVMTWYPSPLSSVEGLSSSERFSA